MHSHTPHGKQCWEAGGGLNPLLGGRARGGGECLLLFKLQKGKNPEQITLVNYLKPLSLSLGEKNCELSILIF